MAPLLKDQVLLVQQRHGEVVDGADGAERHGVVTPPQQVGPEHHRQVAGGHLVHLAVVRYLKNTKRDAGGERQDGERGGGRGGGPT